MPVGLNKRKLKKDAIPTIFNQREPRPMYKKPTSLAFADKTNIQDVNAACKSKFKLKNLKIFFVLIQLNFYYSSVFFFI